MGDFLQHMALLDIESQIASTRRKVAQAVTVAGKAATEAGQAAARATQDQTRRLEKGMASIRTDMLEGFGGVEAQLRVLTTDIGKGLRVLDHSLYENRLAISYLEASMDVVSKNLVIGFGEILSHLEGIENTLSRIETGVMNPEQTRALERYRTARKLAAAGRPTEAMKHIQSAIANDGGLQLTHLPELMAFRAVLRIGHYDTASESVFDGFGALADFEEAIVFAAPAGKGILKLKLAASRFALQDYHGALAIYEGLPKLYMNSFARFQMARCNFAMSRLDAAAEICRALLRQDTSTALLFASDPLCQEHAELFIQIVEQIAEEERKIAEEERKRRLAPIIAFLDELRVFPGVASMSTHLRATFQEILDLPGKVIKSRNILVSAYPQMKDLNDKVAEVLARQNKAYVNVFYTWDEENRSTFKNNLTAFQSASTELDGSISAAQDALDAKTLVLDSKADWSRIASALRQAEIAIDRYDEVLEKLKKLRKNGLLLIAEGTTFLTSCDFTIREYITIRLPQETIEKLKPTKTGSLLATLGLRRSPDKRDQDVELNRKADAMREQIRNEFDDAPKKIAQLMTSYVEYHQRPLRAKIEEFPAKLKDVESQVTALRLSLNRLNHENRQMLIGLNS